MATTSNGTTANGSMPTVQPKDQIDLGTTATEGDIYPNAGAGGLGAGMTGAGLGGIFNFYLYGLGLSNNELLPELPAYWSKQRDAVLSSTMKHEPFWNGAVKKAIAKGVTQQWDLKFNNRNRGSAEKLRELFKASNGRKGFKHFLNQHLQDYFLTDNGAFIEIDREDNSKPGSKIIGLHHLDSLRCYRTGDPDRPVIYADLHNRYHYLTWWQVWDIADTPNPRNNYFGVGDCAAAGAYERIRRMVAIRLYEYQKISGGKPQELNFIQGITQTQLENTIKSNEDNRLAQGMTVYGGAAMIAMMSKDSISHVSVPIARLPDNYKQEEEIEQASIEYANALGISKLDIKPLTGRMSGTATQSDVMDSQQEGSGLGLWSGAFEDFINECVTPSTVSFFWAFSNDRQKKAKADIANVYATAAGTLVGQVQLPPEKAVNWLVDQDVLDPSYLTSTDVSQTNVLSEDDKPDVIDQEATPDQPVATPAVPDPSQAGGVPPTAPTGGTGAVSGVIQQIKDKLAS